MMRQILFAFLLASVLWSCGSARYYSYDVSMAHPLQSKRLYFENDTFSVAFNLNDKAIETFIYNKSNTGIRINWDEVSFSINGKTYRAVHAQTALKSINDAQPPTTIPPKSNLTDYLVPSDKIYFVKQSGYNSATYVAQMFPTYDYNSAKKRNIAKGWKGVRITIYLPFYINNEFKSYYYDLIVDDVKESKKKFK